ncbi:dephospho-CoA kinase-domain-containing protein [Limtongia smithiae]|uniref:dephospho-CoA kinase-domain-containing protein n=1 Tax=Limtongia smithiae TaxID=1125753 RepID=UPI0034CEE631
MLVIGLTGGIATGKSTVSNILSGAPYNLPIIDADKIAREVVDPGTPGYNKIVHTFGPLIPDLLLPAATGTPLRDLNRAALGKYIFGNDDARKALNAIVHPAVRRAIFKRVVYNWLVTRSSAIILDVPLLFEARLDIFCGTTIVVAASRDVQCARILRRDAAVVLSDSDAYKRIDSQMAIDDKVALADYVIWNNEDDGVDALARRVKAVVEGEKIVPSLWWTVVDLIPPVGFVFALVAVAKRYLTRRKHKKLT